MKNEYSEENLIERTAEEIFYEELGWDINYAGKKEVFGEGGTLGRNTESDVILVPALRRIIEKFNPKLPKEAYQKAIDIILSESSYQNHIDINREKYELFRSGVKVTFKNSIGELVKDKSIKIFDFDAPENNEFIAVRQLNVRAGGYQCRTDIVGFVNGIPLIFIELKGVHKNLRSAYNGNLSDYKNMIPKLFNYNALIILSNGLNTKIGSITGNYEHFNDWKRISESEQGVISLDTALRGVCDKKRLMDIFENFILFDNSGENPVKLIARNHQYLGVNKAIESFRNREVLGGKLGVFWHTQGSGKSYSMIFFCQKIHRKLQGAFSFVVVTDREELDKQIYSNFASTGALTEDNVRAESGQHLTALLKENRRYVFTLIHKFNNSQIITERNNVIIISDEAHRTQMGELAVNMRNSMPNASFIGFTGTPLFNKGDEITREIFGGYVSKYDFKRSVQDNSTVALYYENRGEKLKLANGEINEDMRKAVEELELKANQTEKLKRLFLRNYPILTSEKRLRSIARDIVKHFFERGYKGKGLIVCLDKITSVRMYDYIIEYKNKYCAKLEGDIKTKSNTESQGESLNLAWAKETEICVVVSEEQGEIDKFKKWGLDIEPHRLKIKKRNLETDFKNDKHPFRLAIVCAMWITGFDVPSLSTLYLDKPLRGHTLMQTIARVNRVYKDKNKGLVVDYIDNYNNLLAALSIYAATGGVGGGRTELPPIEKLEKLIEELTGVYHLIDEYFTGIGFDLESISKQENKKLKIKAIGAGANAICFNDTTRKKFRLLANRLFQIYNAILPNPIVNPFREKKRVVQTLYDKIEADIESADVSEVIKKVQSVVDKFVTTTLELSEDYSKIFDLSSINISEIVNKIEKSEHNYLTMQQLKFLIEAKINQMIAQNPFREDFRKRYEGIIKEYNEGKDSATVTNAMVKLLQLVQSLSEEQKRVVREGLDEEHMAIFDLLSKPELSQKDREKVKKVAVDLLDKLKAEKLKIDNWREKAEIAAKVRTEILNKLFNDLPMQTYNNDDIDNITNSVYYYVCNRYPNLKYTSEKIVNV